MIQPLRPELIQLLQPLIALATIRTERDSQYGITRLFIQLLIQDIKATQHIQLGQRDVQRQTGINV